MTSFVQLKNEFLHAEITSPNRVKIVENPFWRKPFLEKKISGEYLPRTEFLLLVVNEILTNFSLFFCFFNPILVLSNYFTQDFLFLLLTSFLKMILFMLEMFSFTSKNKIFLKIAFKKEILKILTLSKYFK